MTDRAALIARLQAMADRVTRHDYDIGDYWNYVELAADALAEADAEIEQLKATIFIAEIERFRNKIEQLADKIVIDETKS